MPTARARYRRRPVYDQLARGEVERYSPAESATITPPTPEFLLLTDGASFLLLTDGTSRLQLAG